MTIFVAYLELLLIEKIFSGWRGKIMNDPYLLEVVALFKGLEVTGAGDWWRFYAELGHRLIANEYPVSKIALVVPARAYIASFVAMGAAVASLKKKEPPDRHYKFLQSLDDGAALYFQKSGTARPGRATLIKGDDGELMALTVKNSKDVRTLGHVRESRKYIGLHNCGQFSKADVDVWNGDILNRNHRAHGNHFLSSFFGDKDEYNAFVTSSYSSILCVGIKDLIMQEMGNEILMAKSVEGSVSDFLQLNKPISKAAVISQRGEIEHVRDSITPSVVLYDSAIAFLDHRNAGSRGSYHEIVILDRADPNLQDGLVCWNQGYKETRSQVVDGLHPPAGVEIAVSQGV